MLNSRIKIVIAEYETRTKTKFKRKDAAIKLGISAVYLSDVIAGRKNGSLEILFGLAHLLGCKVDDLYQYEEVEG